MVQLKVNGRIYDVSVAGSTPLLWVIRENLGLTGTKYGCGISRCGACTVLADGQAIRSCVTTVSSVLSKEITTIEGLSPDCSHAVQRAWIEDDVPQCGYCHSGQIMSAAALLARNPNPSDEEIDQAMTGNLCRCGTYARIRRAIHRAAKLMSSSSRDDYFPKPVKRVVQPMAIMDTSGIGSTGVDSSDSFMLNPYVTIGRDGIVTITINKSEMGQGVFTALPMLVADELECGWNAIRVRPAEVAEVYSHTLFGIQMTGGSTSVLSEWDRLRRAGAQAREMLVTAAANLWNLKKEDCHPEKGMIVGPDGRTASYGELAQAASKIPVPAQISLKDRSDFRIIGTATKRLDTSEKVSGEAIFGLDVSFPGMLVALIARSPVFGGKVKSVDAEKTKAQAGVHAVFEVPSGVAVVADTFWAANLGRRALKIDWDLGAHAVVSTSEMGRQYAGLAKSKGVQARRVGDPEAAFAGAARSIDGEYEVPYLAHAPMEPLNCTVDLREDRCDIYAATQFQGPDRKAAAQVAGLDPERVYMHTPFLGGGFGRRANPQSDFVVEAVEVAKVVKKPVKVIWTREDDTKGGYYRPMMADRISAALDRDGSVVAWKHTIVGQSIVKGTPFESFVENGIDPTSVEGAADLPYSIPNILVDLHTTDIGVPVLWWRSVGHSHTAFVVESFIDEVAHAAGRDPFELRRDLLAEDRRRLGVLNLAAEKAGWGTPLPEGRGRGIAVHKSFESYVAQVAEVSVIGDGSVRVHRVVCAVDCGKFVNPATIEAQMEGGIVMGLSAALYGKIVLEEGRVEQGNFSDYPILRIGEMPQVEVHIVASDDSPGGIGEPGVPPIAPAVTNAIFAVTGKRIRKLPINSKDLQ